MQPKLSDAELSHLKATKGLKYGKECELRTHTGFALRYEDTDGPCSYVRVVDPLGREISYWSSEEWAEDPKLVMGAILGSVVRGKPRKPKKAKRQKAQD